MRGEHINKFQKYAEITGNIVLPVAGTAGGLEAVFKCAELYSYLNKQAFFNLHPDQFLADPLHTGPQLLANAAVAIGIFAAGVISTAFMVLSPVYLLTESPRNITSAISDLRRKNN